MVEGKRCLRLARSLVSDLTCKLECGVLVLAARACVPWSLAWLVPPLRWLPLERAPCSRWLAWLALLFENLRTSVGFMRACLLVLVVLVALFLF